MAILDIHDLGLAREKGRDLVGVMALVQAPLAAVLAQPEIKTPKDLEGERAGVSGLPSDVAVLRSIVQGAGGDPDRVKQTTIGFEAVKALLAKRVAGRDRVLERRGRRAEGEAPGHPRVPRRPLRRAVLPGARPVRDPRDAGGQAGARAGDDPRAPARLRADPERPRERGLGDARRASRASIAPSCPRSSTPSPPSSPPARPRSASCGRRCCARGRSGTRSSGSSRSHSTCAAPSTRRSSRSRSPTSCRGPRPAPRAGARSGRRAAAPVATQTTRMPSG